MAFFVLNAGVRNTFILEFHNQEFCFDSGMQWKKKKRDRIFILCNWVRIRKKKGRMEEVKKNVHVYVKLLILANYLSLLCFILSCKTGARVVCLPLVVVVRLSERVLVNSRHAVSKLHCYE